MKTTRLDFRGIAAFSVLAGLLIWASFSVIRFAHPGNDHLSTNSYMGEILLHQIRSMADQVSYRLPGSTLCSALLDYHSRISWSGLLLVSQAVEVTFLFVLGVFLHRLGFIIAAIAFMILNSFDGHYDFTADHLFYRLVLLTACVMAWRARAPSHLRSAALALCLGATLLHRSTFFAFPLLLALFEWIVIHHRSVHAYRRHFLILAVVPYLFLLPWIGANWRIHERFIPFEESAASPLIIMGAMGMVEAVGGDVSDAPYTAESLGLSHLDYKRSADVLGWAAGEISRHPWRYISAFFRRVFLVVSLHPLLFLFAAAALWFYRNRRDFQALGLLGAYFVLIHCLMAVDPRYFEPLWPLLAILAGSLAGAFRPKAMAEASAPEFRFSQAAMMGFLAVVLVFCLYVDGILISYAAALQPNRSGAEKEINSALIAHPLDPWLLSTRGKRRLEQEDFAAAVKDFSAAAVLRPNDGDIRLNRAWALALHGKPAELLGWRQGKASKFSVDAHIRKAIIHVRLGRMRDAEHDLRIAKRLHSESRILPQYIPTGRDKSVLDLMRSSEDDGFLDYCDIFMTARPFNEKLALSEALLTILPENSGLWLRKAAAQVGMDRRSAALISLSRAERLRPSDKQRRRVAELYRRLDEKSRALAALEPLLAGARTAGPLIDYSEIAADSKRRDAALKVLAQAEGLSPIEAERRRMAAVYRRLDEHARALAVFEPVLKSGGGADRWIERSEWAAAAGDRSAALESLAQAQALNPDEPQRRRMAALYRRFNEHARALSILEPVFKNASAPALLIERSEWAAAAGDRALALESLTKAEGLRPSGQERRRIAGLWIDQAGAAGLLKQNDRAREFLARAEALEPGENDLRRIAHGYQKLAAYDRALEILERLTRLRPAQAELYGDKGLCKYLKGSTEAAIVDLQIAIKLDPRLASAYLSLAAIYAAQGRREEAKGVYDRALSKISKADPLLDVVRRAREAF